MTGTWSKRVNERKDGFLNERRSWSDLLLTCGSWVLGRRLLGGGKEYEKVMETEEEKELNNVFEKIGSTLCVWSGCCSDWRPFHRLCTCVAFHLNADILLIFVFSRKYIWLVPVWQFNGEVWLAGRGWNDFIKMFPVRFSGGGPKGRTPPNPAHINNPAPGVSHICSPAPNNHHMINRWRKERTHLCGCKCASSYHSSGGSAFHSIGKDRVSCHCKRRVVNGIDN